RFPGASASRNHSACFPPSPPAATRWAAPESRGCGSGREHDRFPSGSWGTPSGSRHVNACFAQTCELVAQGAWADAEALGRFAPASLVGAQRIENEIALRLYERAGERADRILAG